MDAFPTNIVAKEQDGKNAIWKETCKIICTQKSSVTWRTENTWEHNDILAGLGEKLENFSPPTFFSLEKSCFPTTFPRQTISLKNVGAGLQKWKMPPDAKMPLVPIKMPPVVPTIWLDDQPWNLGCHELQQALLLFRKSSVPDESLARVCVISLNFRWMPMCSMRQGDNAFYPCRVNAPGCWLSASAAAQRSVRCALLKLQLKQGLQTSVTSPNFTTGLPNPLPSVGKLTPGIKKDQSSWTHPASSLCLTKALMVPATERNTGLDISLGVWTSTVENICVLFWKSKLMFTKQDQKIPCFYAERKQNTWNWAVL